MNSESGVRFAGRDKLVHLVGLGEVVERLGRGVADRLDGARQIGQGGGDGNQPVSFTLHGLFSHAPSLDKQQVSKYSQHQAIGGRLRFWNRSFKASCSSPWTVFLSWAASTRSCW